MKRLCAMFFSIIAVVAVCYTCYEVGLKLSDENKAVMSENAVYVDEILKFETERDQLRSVQLTQLREIADSVNSSQELADSANREIMNITSRMSDEQTIKGILEMRGYEGVAIEVNEKTVCVMIRSDSLTDSDIAVISEQIVQQTGLPMTDIQIIPIK